MRHDLLLLRGAVLVEAVSIVILLGNVLTVHWQPISSIAGPVHGSAYLVVITATLLTPSAPRPAKLTALVPGIGGCLALRHVNRIADKQ